MSNLSPRRKSNLFDLQSPKNNFQKRNTIFVLSENNSKSNIFNLLELGELCERTSVKKQKQITHRNSVKVSSIQEENHKNSQSNKKDLNKTVKSRMKVVARFRPPNSFENRLNKNDKNSLPVEFLNEKTVLLKNSIETFSFELDRVFDEKTSQKEFFEEVSRSTIEDFIAGYNGALLAYGQSGSGKTFTMFGSSILDEEKKGVIPRILDKIFDFIDSNDTQSNDVVITLSFSMIEIYKEMIYDLLNPFTSPSSIKIKENLKGMILENITEASIESKEEFFQLLQKTEESRSVAETCLNKNSSRSHVIFMLSMNQIFEDGSEKLSILNLVDLAGSEKVSKTHSNGETLEEAKKINLSLSALTSVINSLAKNQSQSDFVPYRDSKLTRILKDSLGGNYKTTMIVCCSPHIFNIEETLSTLNFARRSKKLKNSVKINLKRNNEDYERIILELENKLSMTKKNEIQSPKRKSIAGPLPQTSPRKRNDKSDLLKNSGKINEEGSFVQMESFRIGAGLITDTNNFTISKEANFEIFEKKNGLNLSEEIEFLKNENSILKEKILHFQQNLSYDENIEKLEMSVKRILEEINLQIKISNERFKEMEKYIQNDSNRKKEKSSILAEILTKHSFQETKNQLETIIKELTKENSSKYFDGSLDYYLSQIKLLSSKQLNEILNELLESDFKLKNQFIVENGSIENKNSLKNSFLKISILASHYESIIAELAHNLTLDILTTTAFKNFSLNFNDKYQELTSIFNNYFEYLKELKNFKYQGNFLSSNQLRFEPNFARSGRKKTILASKKVMNCKDLLNQISIKNEGKLTVNFKQLDNLENGSSECIEGLYENVKLDARKSNMSHMNIIRVNKFENNLIQKKEETNEIILLRKEISMNAKFIEILNRQIDDYSNKLKSSELIKDEKEIYSKNNYQSRKISNLLQIKLIKEFYCEEIEILNHKIQELSSIIDDMILNFKTKSPKEILPNLYEIKKERILEHLEDRYCLKNYGEGLLNECGSATKRLDFIKFDLEKNEKFSVNFGSGLNHITPFKCPLYKNLKTAMVGDHNSGVVTPEFND